MKILYYSGWSLTRLVSKIVFRIKVSGREHFPKSGGFILATNHRSYFDPLLVGSWAPRQVYFLAKQELFKNKFFGRIITATNALPVRRGTIDRNALKLCLDAIDGGDGLTIFPEGTRAKGADFLEPKPGVAMIATQAKVPIVPGYVHGSNRLKDCFWGRDRLRIRFGKPILPEDIESSAVDKEGYIKLTQLVMERIEELKQQTLGAQ